MNRPSWFARRYPSIEDLESFAWEMGAVVMRGACGTAQIVYSDDPEDVAVICIPSGLSPLEEIWQLAHEVGHLVLHSGYTSPWMMGRQEADAERWAARALIPRTRISHHQNASLDAFIGALSAHYEELPLEDCPARRLAAHIAKIRLRSVEEVA